MLLGFSHVLSLMFSAVQKEWGLDPLGPVPILLGLLERKIHAETGAAANFAVDLHAAAVRGDDVVRDGQSQPGSFADVFGGKKRIEELIAIFGGNAGTVVLHFD